MTRDGEPGLCYLCEGYKAFFRRSLALPVWLRAQVQDLLWGGITTSQEEQSNPIVAPGITALRVR
jgi:hypothetical protein